jgi:NAD kinase
MTTLSPRVVMVTRETEYERLVFAHATPAQARFYLRTRQQTISKVETVHNRFQAAVQTVRSAIAPDWKVARVGRADLDKFLFTPEDVVVVIGQDGLVANVAKYLDGQPVLGVNPAPDENEGVLVTLRPEQAARLMLAAAERSASMEPRTMALASLETGESLEALNEIFLGHRSHQSARYVIEAGGAEERQSSSGVIVATGTGATGWARSIMTQTGNAARLAPTEPALAFFVREPWPSVATGANVATGEVSAGQPLSLVSQMNEGGVIFADGIEQDFLDFGFGRRAEVTVSGRKLMLVRG